MLYSRYNISLEDDLDQAPKYAILPLYDVPNWTTCEVEVVNRFLAVNASK